MKSIIIIFYLAILTIFVSSCENSSSDKMIVAKEKQKVLTEVGDNWKVNVEQSSINWIGRKPGGSHTGTLGLKTGTLTFKDDAPVAGQFILDMNKIINNDLTDMEYNQKLVNHLKSDAFFNVERYPEGSFMITKIKSDKTDSTTHVISGNLKLKDTELNIKFKANIYKNGNTYRAISLPFYINRTQWGVNYGSKNIFKNLTDQFIYDDIFLKVDLVLEK